MPFLVLIVFAAAGARLAAAGQGFVGIDDKGSLVLEPPAGGQVLVDGVAFQELVRRLDEQAAEIRALKQQQQAAGGAGRLLPSEYFRARLGHLYAGAIITVDDARGAGGPTSIAMAPGHIPVIAYRDTFGSTVKLATCNDAKCTGSSVRTLSSTSGVRGSGISLAVNSSANASVIAFRDETGPTLKLAVCVDLECSSSTTYTVDKTGNAGHHPSLSLSSAGYPVISYQEGVVDVLKLAICPDFTCEAPTIRILADRAQYMSLALTPGNDHPVVAFQDISQSVQVLRVAVCEQPLCSSFIVSTIDDGGNTGIFTDLALTSGGAPVILYHRVRSSTELMLALCHDPKCTAEPTVFTVDDVGSRTWFPSLQLTAEGYPVMAYYNKIGADPCLARCSDANCTSITRRTLESGADDIGMYPSLALTDLGYPIISFQKDLSGTATALQLVVCEDATCF